MMYRIFITFTILFSLNLLSCTDKGGGIPHYQENNTPHIVMHKGLHLGGKLAPHNSLDALRLASRVGARFVEIDVSITKDGEFILLHNNTLEKVFHKAKDYTPVEDGIFCNSITLEEFRNDYVLIADDPSMRRPVPTLEEGLTLCKAEGLYPYVEIKENITKEEDVKKVYDMVNRIMGKGNYSMTSFKRPIVQYLRSLDKDVPLYQDMVEDVDYLKKHRINYYPRYEPSWYSKPPKYDEAIAKIHAAGLSASTWTVRKEAYDTIVVKGYDGIITDEIAPRFRREFAVFNDNSDGNFFSYATNGLLSDNVLHMQKGQTIELNNPKIDSLYLGALYFSVEAKGRFTIKANDFDVERENTTDDYKIYRFQFFLHKEKPFFKIESLGDSTIIKSIWLAVTEY